MTNTAIQDVQKQDPGSAYIQLFELALSSSSSAYFHSGLDDDLTTIQMRDYANPSTIRTYIALPSQFKGVEIKNDGAIARPELTLANAQTVFSDAVGTLDYQKFLGLKIIRRTNITSTKGVTFISDIGTDLRLCLRVDFLKFFKFAAALILTIQLTAQYC